MKYKIIRIAACLAAMIGCFLLQSNLTRLIPFLTAVPNLLLILTFSIGFLRGSMAGLLTGLGCGLLMDAFSGQVLGYYTLIFIYIGYFNGFLTRILSHDMIVMPLILCIVNELAYSLYIYIFSFLLFGRTRILDYLMNPVMPELILTILFTVILYGIIMTADRKLLEAEKKGENTIA